MEVFLIHYTLQGPGFEMEIHEDKIKLIKKAWKFFTKDPSTQCWDITELAQFEITTSKLLLSSGKIQWTTFNGEHGAFEFTTNPAMVKKIETYLQKRVLKNHQVCQKPVSKKDGHKQARAA